MPRKTATATVEAAPLVVDIADPPVVVPDRYDAEIARLEAAIEALHASTSPEYIARPHKRADLQEDLLTRIASLREAQRRHREAEAERRVAAEQRAAWDGLHEQRIALAERWNAIRAEIVRLVDDCRAAELEHGGRAQRRLFSEPIGPHTISRARLDANNPGSPIAVLSSHL